MGRVPVETVNCALTFFFCAKLTETKSYNQLDTIDIRRITSGAISLAIDQNAELVDLATTGKEITQLVLSGSPWDVADED